MRRPPQSRPKSRESATPQITAPVKKVFNCIADETALLAGAKKSTRDGIRKWITNGQIRLFVPLYTLNQATRLKDNSTGRVSSDAEEALFWLDDATSNAPHLVTLQGGYEKFETWAEVEKFALPKPLFSEEDVEEYEHEAEETVDASSNKLSASSEKVDKHLSMSSADSEDARSGSPDSHHSLRSSMSPLSPPESPEKATVKPAGNASQKHSSGSPGLPSTKKSDEDAAYNSGVPPHLRPLFNYILWRVQQEIDPAAALESFIFLCDDPIKAKLAQRFGIRVKSLADIRYVVAREEREFRNRQLVQRKENEKAGAVNTASGKSATKATAIAASAPVREEEESSDEDDEVVFKRPPKAPAAMIAAQSQQSPRAANSKVMDPNQFSRTPGGRGNARAGSGRGAARGGRGGALPIRETPARVDVTPTTNGNTGPIDPDSFSRPTPNGGRGRGASRRLFIPT